MAPTSPRLRSAAALAVNGMTDHPLTCAECGIEAPPDATGWRAYVVSVRDEMNDEEYVTVYCPECAAREFGRT